MKKVQVFMSTYNGGIRIIKQVETIMNQLDVKIQLIIRDDGSSQQTKDILKSLSRKYTNLSVIYGNNIGYKKSFLKLLGYLNDEVDYCAFADQDDIWERDKVIKAISKLENIEHTDIKLYISSLNIYDEKLNFLKKNDISNVPNNLCSLFTRTRFAGCTFVFTSSLARLLKNYDSLDYVNSEMPDHDFFVAAFGYTYGRVILDSNAYIKHIRYPNSVTSGGNGLKKRIMVEYDNTFKKKDTRLHMAQVLLHSDKNKRKISNVNVKRYLETVVTYKSKLMSKIMLISKMRCGSAICNLESAFKITIGKF